MAGSSREGSGVTAVIPEYAGFRLAAADEPEQEERQGQGDEGASRRPRPVRRCGESGTSFMVLASTQMRGIR